VLVDAPNPGGRLLPGMTADLSFEIERADDVLLVPDSALRFEPEPGPEGAGAGAARGGWGGGAREGAGATGGHATAAARPAAGRVHVLRDGELAEVAVQTGLTDGLRTAVVGGDLHEGDEVVTGALPVASGAPTGSSNPFLPGRPSGGGGGRPRL